MRKKILIVLVVLVVALGGIAFAYQGQTKTTPLLEGLEGVDIVQRKVGFIEGGGLRRQVTQWYVKGVEINDLNEHIGKKSSELSAANESAFCAPSMDDELVLVVSGPVNTMDYAFSWITNRGKVPQPQTINSPAPSARNRQGGGADGEGGLRGRGPRGGRDGGGGDAPKTSDPDQRGKSKTGPDGP